MGRVIGLGLVVIGVAIIVIAVVKPSVLPTFYIVPGILITFLGGEIACC